MGILAARGAASTWLLALAVVAGLPHGAADLDVGRATFHAFGRLWWRPFLLVYLGLGALTLLTWAIAPTLMLGAFLLLSARHFGEQDAANACTPDWTAAIAHGGTALVVPTLAHPQAVAGIFVILAGSHAPTLTYLLAGPAAAGWLSFVALHTWRTMCDGRWRASADLLLVATMFAAAPPLVAFSLYFALLHTPRALIDQHDRFGRIVRPGQMAGLTALACLLGLAIFLAGRNVTVEAAVMRTSFLLLSALTIPHMALEQLGRATARQVVHV